MENDKTSKSDAALLVALASLALSVGNLIAPSFSVLSSGQPSAPEIKSESQNPDEAKSPQTNTPPLAQTPNPAAPGTLPADAIKELVSLISEKVIPSGDPAIMLHILLKNKTPDMQTVIKRVYNTSIREMMNAPHLHIPEQRKQELQKYLDTQLDQQNAEKPLQMAGGFDPVKTVTAQTLIQKRQRT